MSQREDLQAGIDSFGYRIAATAKNFANEPSEKNGGDGLKYARKLVVYGKALEILRAELALLDVASEPAQEKEETPKSFSNGWGWR